MESVHESVRTRYSQAAQKPDISLCCPTGYDKKSLSYIPKEVLEVSYGCGTPAGLETVKRSETVLDIGSGGGIDCFIAAKMVGEKGQVIGVDMTPEMLELSRRSVPVVMERLGYPVANVEFLEGEAEKLPAPDSSVDLIISNCVINLSPAKEKVFSEMFRVLKPYGRFTISDIVADQKVPNYLLFDEQKWGCCLSGALQVGDYLSTIQQAGFSGVHQVKWNPWRVIDGIHFYSLTLTGYKVPESAPSVLSSRAQRGISAPSSFRYATLRGPFRQITDPFGVVRRRGEPFCISPQEAHVYALNPFSKLFLLTETPLHLTEKDLRYVALYPEQRPCVWEGDYAILTGCLKSGCDDDQHFYKRGEPLEICSKTKKVLSDPLYRDFFTILRRAEKEVAGKEVSCDSSAGCC